MKLIIHGINGSKYFINHSLKKGVCLEIHKVDGKEVYSVSLVTASLYPIEVSKDEFDRLDIIMRNIISAGN